jgi:hypothetical protein
MKASVEIIINFLYSIFSLVPIREAAENIGRLTKIISPYFNA